MKNSKSLPIITILIYAVLLLSCKKETSPNEQTSDLAVDYRDSFCDQFHFTVIKQSWMLGQPTTYDTISYFGNISKYNISENEEVDSSYHASERVIIEYGEPTGSSAFGANNRVNSRIELSGFLVPESGYHYHHEGHFISNDSIIFQVTGLGGLGGGTNFYVKGARQ